MNISSSKITKLGILLIFASLLFSTFTATGQTTAKDPVRIGIAWRTDMSSEFFTNIVSSIQAAGAEAVRLDQVRYNDFTYSGNTLSDKYIDGNDVLRTDAADLIKTCTFEQTNAAYVVSSVDAVVFTGGEDICPTLYSTPEPWHGIAAEKDYNATRDVSDYLLMRYCIDQDIPVIGICRGMQMLSIVSGASMIQDIPTYFSEKGKTYKNDHRNIKVGDAYQDYASHDVTVKDKNSIFYSIVKTKNLKKVPSWHHQGVKSTDGTNLKVTGYTSTCGEEMIEAVERTDKKFITGIQFHPEVAVYKNAADAPNKDSYMSPDAAMTFFHAIIAAAEDHRKNDQTQTTENMNTTETILALEKAALKAWLSGNPTPYLELYTSDFTYFDSAHGKRIDGFDKIKELYESVRGQLVVTSYEIIDPVVQATDNMAVLTYNLETYIGETLIKENCTEVYRFEGEKGWKIIHSHWSDNHK